MKSSRVQLAAVGAAIAISTSFTNPVAAINLRFRQIYIFGDSLSDPGNVYTLSKQTIPPSPPYFDGRFSNGPVWAEKFDNILGLTPQNYADLGRPGHTPPREGVNFAFAGATSGRINLFGSSFFGLQQQIDKFVHLKLTQRPPTLYALWIGANDYLSDPFQGVMKQSRLKPLSPPFVPRKTPTETVGHIVSTLKTLTQSGAKTILVFNLPDLGKTPFGRSNTTLSTALTQLTQAHNAALKSELSSLSKQYPKTQFISVDINRLFKLVSTQPYLFKLSNVKESCLNTTVTPPKICDRPDQYLFWDDVHPTKVGHQIIAKFVFANLFWQGQTKDPSRVFSLNEMLPILSANNY
ncbi:MAG: SGNH/GDSL hydrolase family protein [Thermosynechococcaceae cyanobacterium]